MKTARTISRRAADDHREGPLEKFGITVTDRPGDTMCPDFCSIMRLEQQFMGRFYVKLKG
jgi:hypothetical protein